MIYIALGPTERLRFLIEFDDFRLCRLLDASDFVRYAKERGVETDVARLERLDRLGVFRPMMRVRRPLIREKVRGLPNGQVEVLGLLEDGEAWEGAKREGYASFEQTRETLAWYLENGHLWHPASREHVPWDSAARDEYRRPIELAFYSRFQVRDLEKAQAPLTMRVILDDFAGKGADAFARLGESLRDYEEKIVRHAGEHPNDDAVPFLAQALASRYYPQTQGDRRTIQVSTAFDADGWEWWDYARE